jgi:hypothetical protein
MDLTGKMTLGVSKYNHQNDVLLMRAGNGLFYSLTDADASADQTVWEDLDGDIAAGLAEDVQHMHSFTQYHHYMYVVFHAASQKLNSHH